MIDDLSQTTAGALVHGRVPARKSRVVGRAGAAAPPGEVGSADLVAPAPRPDPDERVDVILELNMKYPGSIAAAGEAFGALWQRMLADSGPKRRGAHSAFAVTQISRKLYQAVLSPPALERLLALDDGGTTGTQVIFRVWPDYPMYPQIDRSAPTVKVDAARRAFRADGVGVVWAVVDTGIDGRHPHFSALELSREGLVGAAPGPVTGGRHRDFSALVQPSQGAPAGPGSPLTDEDGHGTHVAGIIAGACPAGLVPHVAASDEATDGGYVARRHGQLDGMAPQCELISLKVFRRINGVAVTSSAAVIAALEYIRTELNVGRSALRVHGVNLSLGCDWDPSHYAAGQSPLCQLINELVSSGVVVVISAGNNGRTGAAGSANQSVGVLASITEPGHADACITVGSTHRDAPHVFGISYTSSKGPTLDGRSKPDVVAPGEWICSAATGPIRLGAGLGALATDPFLTYAELSGTSMAAPHVSGVIAGFLSSRPEYMGRPADVKALLSATATDLGRDRLAQGAGLVDAMRMLSNS